MRLIDADALLRDIDVYHLSDGKFQHWIEIQPTIDAVPLEQYRSMERTCYKLQKTLYEMADRKTEPQTFRCPKCGRTDYIRDMEKDMGIKDSCYKYKCINCNTYIKDEPQTDYKKWTPPKVDLPTVNTTCVTVLASAFEDEPIDRDELGDCNICKYVGLEHRCNQCVNGSQFYKFEDEPQTERTCTNCKHNGVLSVPKCDECHDMDKHEFIEPQTERSE